MFITFQVQHSGARPNAGQVDFANQDSDGPRFIGQVFDQSYWDNW